MKIISRASIAFLAFCLLPDSVASVSAQQVQVGPLPEIAPTFAVVARLVAANNIGNFPWRTVLRDIPKTEEREMREDYAIPVYRVINQRLGGDTNALACSMAVELTRSRPEQVEMFNQAILKFDQANPTGDLYRNLLFVRDLTPEQKQALQALRELETQLFLEADKRAIEWMARAGFDPKGCIRAFMVYQEYDQSNPDRGQRRLKSLQGFLRENSALRVEDNNLVTLPILNWEFTRGGANFNLLIEEKNN